MKTSPSSYLGDLIDANPVTEETFGEFGIAMDDRDMDSTIREICMRYDLDEQELLEAVLETIEDRQYALSPM